MVSTSRVVILVHIDWTGILPERKLHLVSYGMLDFKLADAAHARRLALRDRGAADGHDRRPSPTGPGGPTTGH